MINCLILNLARAPDRLAFMSKQMDSLQLKWVRIDGVDQSLMDIDEINRFKQQNPLPKKIDRDPLQVWNPGQIGCYLSHKKAWQSAFEAGHAYTAIFEDDVHLCDDVSILLRSDSWIPRDADLIRLETTSEKVMTGFHKYPLPEDVSQKRKLVRLLSTTVNAGAYIVSKDAAKKLLEESERGGDVVDFFLFSKRHSAIARKMVIYQIAPAVAVQDRVLTEDDTKFISSISSPRRRRGPQELVYRKALALAKIACGGGEVRFRE